MEKGLYISLIALVISITINVIAIGEKNNLERDLTQVKMEHEIEVEKYSDLVGRTSEALKLLTSTIDDRDTTIEQMEEYIDYLYCPLEYGGAKFRVQTSLHNVYWIDNEVVTTFIRDDELEEFFSLRKPSSYIDDFYIDCGDNGGGK